MTQASLTGARFPARASLGQFRGVDLHLGALPVVDSHRRLAGDGALDSCPTFDSTFWQHVDGAAEVKSGLNATQKSLLQAVYNPSLCDRREEGELFMPPDTTIEYARKLKGMVDTEKHVMTDRKEHFFSTSFVPGKTVVPDKIGSDFPSAWATVVEIANGYEFDEDKPKCPVTLHPRPDYKAKAAALLRDAMQSTTPTFEKSTEDGTVFRIYRFGSLEVRTTQDPNGQEEVGVVYSHQAPTASKAVEDTEKIEKVVLYAERDLKREGGHRFYILIETNEGSLIVTEQLLDGNVTWEENPADVGSRNSMAKVIKAADCGDEHLTVQAIRKHHITRTRSAKSAQSRARYAEQTFDLCIGKATLKRRAEPFSTFVGKHCSWLQHTLRDNEDIGSAPVEQ